jgi:uncharacterized protein (TIGR03118 family)
VSNEGSGTSTFYAGTSSSLNRLSPVVSIPGDRPTGQAFNTTAAGTTPGFLVTEGKTAVPAQFLFATLNGVIAGWAPVPVINPATTAPRADPPASQAAQVGVKVPGAVFTGLAQEGNRLYAADVAHHAVDVLGPDFRLLNLPGAFQDRFIPAGFSPFNVVAIGNEIYVTYSAPLPGRGRGFVDVFTQNGVLVKRLIRGGLLDQPWGVAMAPADWGPFGGDLLVGNHGNGQVNAYDPVSGRFAGTLQADGRTFVAPNLWGLIFGDGPAPGVSSSAGDKHTLFFTEGSTPGRHGEIGDVRLVP